MNTLAEITIPSQTEDLPVPYLYAAAPSITDLFAAIDQTNRDRFPERFRYPAAAPEPEPACDLDWIEREADRHDALSADHYEAGLVALALTDLAAKLRSAGAHNVADLVA